MYPFTSLDINLSIVINSVDFIPKKYAFIYLINISHIIRIILIRHLSSEFLFLKNMHLYI